MSKRKIIFLCLTISWMIFIFIMSQTPGNESSNMSGGIVDKIKEVFVPNYYNYDIVKQDRVDRVLTTIVRKGAHMAEYAILVTFVCMLLFDLKLSIRMPLSFIVTFVYACTDEFHQLFIDGRAGRFTDVLIDMGGAFIAMLIIGLVFLIRFKNNKGKNSETIE